MTELWEFVCNNNIILTAFLHLILIVPMFIIYKKEKARLEEEEWG